MDKAWHELPQDNTDIFYILKYLFRFFEIIYKVSRLQVRL